MPQIYKITNLINNKIYIGKSNLNNENYYGSGLQIVAAVKKYGKENFSKEILEECPGEVIDQREIFWIEKLNACDTAVGYNISIGGTGGNHYWKSLNEADKLQLREKISRSRSGQKTSYSEDRRKNVKDGLKKWWSENKNNTEWLMNRGNSKSKDYILSDGIEFIRIKNIRKYSDEYNLDNGWLVSIATGKKFTPNKGYYCVFDIGQTDDAVLTQIEDIKNKQTKVLDKWLEKARNREKYECGHCKKVVTKTNLIRWHNNNCKEYGKNNITDTR